MDEPPPVGWSSRIPVLLGDDNPLILSALSEVFGRDPRFTLAGSAATAETFLAQAANGAADLGVVSWTLPVLGAQKLIDLLRDTPDAPRVVVYGDTGPDVARKAMAAGAAGFAARSAPVEVLVDTCLAVARGQMVFPFLDVRRLHQDPINLLSRRERILLELLAGGRTNRELARQLDISENTVKFHLSNLFEKLAVKNRAQAIAFYYGSAAGKEIT